MNPASATSNTAVAYVSISLVYTSHANCLPVFSSITAGVNSLVSPCPHKAQSHGFPHLCQEPLWGCTITVFLEFVTVIWGKNKSKQNKTKKKISILGWKTFCQKQLTTSTCEEHSQQEDPQHPKFLRFMVISKKNTPTCSEPYSLYSLFY